MSLAVTVSAEISLADHCLQRLWNSLELLRQIPDGPGGLVGAGRRPDVAVPDQLQTQDDLHLLPGGAEEPLHGQAVRAVHDGERGGADRPADRQEGEEHGGRPGREAERLWREGRGGRDAPGQSGRLRQRPGVRD